MLEQLKEEEEKCQAELKKRREEGNISYILLYQSYLEELLQRIEKEQVKMEKLFAMMEEKKKELRFASKEKMVVERLKKKRWLEFVSLMEREEQGLIDESAIAKFNAQKQS